MVKVDELENLQQKLEEEGELWEKAGYSLENTAHSSTSLFIIKQQIQAIQNLLLKLGVFNEDELNIEFKRLMLGEMIALREQMFPILGQQRILGNGKDIAVPDSGQTKIFGSDGKEIRF